MTTVAFPDEDELLRLVGGLFEQAFAEPELADRFSSTGVVLHIVCTNPECSLLVDLPNQRVYPGSVEQVVPNARLELSGSDANRYLQGELNLAAGIADGSVRISGAITALLAHAPRPAELRERYRSLLVEQGRHDLLV